MFPLSFYRSGLLALGLTPIASLQVVGAAEIRPLSIAAGQSIVLHVSGLTRVGVGDGRIAGVAPLADSQVVINGKVPGRTTVFLWTGSQRATYIVTVQDQNLEDLARMLRGDITAPGVKVVTLEHSIVIDGTVTDPAQSAQITDVVARFQKLADAGNFTVVNAVAVANPFGKLASGADAVDGVTGLHVDKDDDGDLIVSGQARDRTAAEAALAQVQAQAGPLLSKDAKVVDRLAVSSTSQIDVKVYVLEVDSTAQSNLGLQLQSAVPAGSGSSGGVPIGGTTYTLGTPSIPIVENPTNVTQSGHPFSAGPFLRVGLLAPTINLLLTEGHARVLSSPDLVSLPGSNATFLVGGQVPIPEAGGLGTTTITYHDFGVKLDETPTLLSNGSIETKIKPEVSNLDFADGVIVNGFTIPAFKISRLSTDVITQSGESIIMGGLLSRMETKNVQKVPLLGDIPVLGQLFKSTSYQNNQSDVVFVMTPQLLVR
jgi:Flp pilus assembly secretin CpaC